MFVIQPYSLKAAASYADEMDAQQILDNILSTRSVVAEDELETLPIWSIPSSIDLTAVVGYIAIPSVNLHLPILAGATRSHLQAAAATIKQGQRMGRDNYAIAGHLTRQKDTLFSPLHRVVIGDIVYLTDKVTVFRYQVEDIQIVSPNHIEVLSDFPGRSIVTLVTCEDSKGKERRIVVARLIDQTAFKTEDFAMFQS